MPLGPWRNSKMSVCKTVRFDDLPQSKLDVIWKEIRSGSKKRKLNIQKEDLSNRVEDNEYD